MEAQQIQEMLAHRSQGMHLADLARKYHLVIAEVVAIIEAEKRRRVLNRDAP